MPSPADEKRYTNLFMGLQFHSPHRSGCSGHTGAHISELPQFSSPTQHHGCPLQEKIQGVRENPPLLLLWPWPLCDVSVE